MHIHHLKHALRDPVEIHRYGIADRDALILLLGASLATFALTRLYTRLARHYNWRSNKIGDVHVHHLVVGVVLVLGSGMLMVALRLGETGREVLAFVFGVGGAFILDEFALTFHLRDVYWTEEGRRSIDASIMWLLLGLMLLVGISPFGIHDHTVIPRSIGFGMIVVSIVLSVITCLKGKLTLGLVSIFVPPVGVVTSLRLARPGSVWAQRFYPPGSEKLARSKARIDPHGGSQLERLRIRAVDLVAGAHDSSPHP